MLFSPFGTERRLIRALGLFVSQFEYFLLPPVFIIMLHIDSGWTWAEPGCCIGRLCFLCPVWLFWQSVSRPISSEWGSCFKAEKPPFIHTSSALTADRRWPCVDPISHMCAVLWALTQTHKNTIYMCLGCQWRPGWTEARDRQLQIDSSLQNVPADSHLCSACVWVCCTVLILFLLPSVLGFGWRKAAAAEQIPAELCKWCKLESGERMRLRYIITFKLTHHENAP